jgi:HlyD family secretion protein
VVEAPLEPQPATLLKPKKSSKVWWIIAVVLLLGVGGFLLLTSFLSGSSAVGYVTVPVSYADISATVTETGIVNPVTQVTVGSEVSGTVKEINADFNSKVTKGQVLAKLDPTTFQSVVDSSQATLRLQQANAESAVVNVGKMRAVYNLATLTMNRDLPLVAKGLIDQNQMDIDRTAAETAKQDWLAAQAQVRVANAQVAVAKGELAQSEFNLSKTVILSPFDGVVMNRNVSIGQTVAASLSTPTLFTLATDLTDMQVDTSVDEADVGSLAADQTATITASAFPNVVFPGTVLQVRINPTTVSNVVTYDAVIKVHDTTGRLLPGMTAQVVIQTAKKSHVLSVPIAAQLYRPLTTGTTSSGTSGAASSSGGTAALPVAGAAGSKVTVWKLVDGKPVSQTVVIGLSDGKNLEITDDSLEEGAAVIVSQHKGGSSNQAAKQSQ